MKKAIVLAAGYDQIAIIQLLKKGGYYVHTIDYLGSPPAKAFSDEHHQISTLDTNEVLKAAIKIKPSLVTTGFTDQALVTAAFVSEKLKLPFYLSYEQALLVTNKKYMKRFMEDSCLPSANYQIYCLGNNKDVLSTPIYSGVLPVVVKPLDANSSKGITLVKHDSELKEAIISASSFSRSNEIIIEEYMKGKEISVDVIVNDFKVEIILLTETIKQGQFGNFTITQSNYPAKLSTKQKHEVKYVIQKLAKALNIKSTPLIVQIILTGEGPKIIEFSARMGGGTKHQFIKALTNVNVVEVCHEITLKKPFEIGIKKRFNFGLMQYCYMYKGNFREVQGLDELRESKVIDEYFLYKKSDVHLPTGRFSSDRVFGYMILSNELSDLNKRMEQSKSSVKILDMNGEDVLIKEYLGDLL